MRLFKEDSCTHPMIKVSVFEFCIFLCVITREAFLSIILFYVFNFQTFQVKTDEAKVNRSFCFIPFGPM